MIPQTFEQWKSCIVNDCRIKLTKDFVSQRLAVYHGGTNLETQHFISLYGQQHLQNVIGWFEQVVLFQ